MRASSSGYGSALPLLDDPAVATAAAAAPAAAKVAADLSDGADGADGGAPPDLSCETGSVCLLIGDLSRRTSSLSGRVLCGWLSWTMVGLPLGRLLV